MSAAITWTSAAALRRVIVWSVCLSTPDDGHGLQAGLSCQMSSRHTRRELFDREESAPWKSMKTGGDLLTVGGTEEGGLRTTASSPDDAAAGGETTIIWKE